MGDNLIILTSKLLTRESLLQVVLSVDGTANPAGDDDLFDVSRVNEYAHAMVSLDDSIVPELAEYEPLLFADIVRLL